jgi:hypothetical protein
MTSFLSHQKDIHEAWTFCGSNRKFKLNWPILMSLCQCIPVVICKDFQSKIRLE